MDTYGGAIYFNVVVWGEEFRELMLRLLVPSLLAPGNVPALSNPGNCRFLVVTTPEDRAHIEGHPSFQKLAGLIEPIFREIPFPKPEDNKHLVMSAGHAWASDLTFKARAFGAYLTPDMVWADGTVIALEGLGREGKDVVLVAALRFALEGCVAEIDSAFDPQPGKPLVMSPRELTGIAVRNKHPETMRFEFASPYLCDMPWALVWDLPDGSGMLIHSYSWAPLLVNYAAIDEHDVSSFENWTLDGDYIYRNFSRNEGIHVVTDSDELQMISFTPYADLPNVPFDPMRPHWYRYLAAPVVGSFLRKALTRTIFHESTVDPLKRMLFPQAVWFHSKPRTRAWRLVEARGRKAVGDCRGRLGQFMRHARTSLILPPNLSREEDFLRHALSARLRRFFGVKAGERLARRLTTPGAGRSLRGIAKIVFTLLDAWSGLFLRLHRPTLSERREAERQLQAGRRS